MTKPPEYIYIQFAKENAVTFEYTLSSLSDKKMAVAIEALTKIASQTEDIEPPFRAIPRSVMIEIADKALQAIKKTVEDEEKGV